MPAKLTADANSAFLYAIIKNANLQSINWRAIGAEFNISGQAAYMRYARLKAAIEEKGNDGSASLAPNTPSKATPKKVRSSSQKGKLHAVEGEDNEDEVIATPTKKRKGNTGTSGGDSEGEDSDF